MQNCLEQILFKKGLEQIIYGRKVIRQLTFPAMSGAEPCTASASAIPPSPMLQLQNT
jgi:hypothetical protein